MTTASQVITRAAVAIRYLARGETLSAQDASDGLIAFNAMLDSWSNDNLFSYEVQERSFTLSISTASYTIGSGGAINTTRPEDITQAYIQDTGGNNFLMNIRTRDWWNQIGNRSSTITSQIPTDLFYDPQFPLGVINVFPVPLLNYTLFYDSTLQQTTYSTLTHSLSMPEGYERAYVLNLAIDLISAGFPAMLSQEAMATLIENARQAKAAIKRTNIKDVISQYDGAIVSRSYATYNIYRDSSS